MNTETKKTINKQYIIYGLILLAGLFFGWLIFSGNSSSNNESENASHAEEHDHDHDHGDEVWTCSMHPQIRMDKPGKCPLCAMDLTPLKTTGSGEEAIDHNAIQLSAEAVALANIQTTVVNRQNPVKDVRLYGTIEVDERLSHSQTSHVNGRVEKLMVTFTGERVRKGQTIATIYSPELLSAQQELLEAVKMKDIDPALLQAVKEKLSLWKLTDEQIASIEQSGVVSPILSITANTGGIVISKNINQGDYISTGTVLFDIADLSSVWAVFDVYESDLPFLKLGNQLTYTLQSLPGKTFTGKISFINPILNSTTRTAKVRVETNNPRHELMPGMYANAVVNAPLEQYNNEIVIPKSAVLWTGKRSIVYVKQRDTQTPAFLLREVTLGPSLGDAYLILSGIEDGEEIVTNGTFTIDASAQLSGKPSMMNNETGHSVHSHEGAGAHSTHQHTQQTHAMLMVQGLCEMCKANIENAAKSVKGVSSADWDREKKQLHLHYDDKQTNIDAVSKAIAKVGYDTERDKADKAIYDALPPCCKYRE